MKTIFVFGSNRLGIHGAGAAKHAYCNKGAVWGIGEGLQGNSYAIPTKSTPWAPLKLEEVKTHVDRFVAFAKANPDMTFEVTKIGCGLARFREDQIAPLFKDAPDNCLLPDGWRELSPGLS